MYDDEVLWKLKNEVLLVDNFSKILIMMFNMCM